MNLIIEQFHRRKYLVQIRVSKEQVDLSAKYGSETSKIYTHMIFRPLEGHFQM